MNELVKYDQARHALQQCANIDEVKLLLDQSEAMLAYAKQRDDNSMEIWVAEIKLRAMRKFGELSLKIETTQGKPTSSSAGRSETKADVLKKSGTTVQKANRCEKVFNVPSEEFEEVIEKAKEENTPITYAQVEKEVIKANKNKEVSDDIEQQKDDIEASDMPVLENKYHVIAIDPPWPYELKLDAKGKPIRTKTTYDANSRRVANPYPEMSIEEIRALPIPAADDCIMWLWTTHKFLPDSFALLEGWGFEYKATMVWDKQKMGVGHWLRMQCEFCLMAIKGNPLWSNTTQRDLLSSGRREHSRKPDEFFMMVDDICVGAKFDYFSREEREGWDNLGNNSELFNI